MIQYPRYPAPKSRITWNDSLQAWLLWQYEDVLAMLKDERFSAMSPDGMPMPEAYPKETHRFHRQQFTSLLQQNASGTVRQIKTSATEVCKQLENQEKWDLSQDLIKPCCQKIAMALLDFEVERLDELQTWAEAVFYMGEGEADYQRGTEATICLGKYFQEKILLRLKNPETDLLSVYLQNKEASDLWLSHILQFWVGFCTSLPLLLGNIVVALCMEEDGRQKALYMETPAGAVSELLRFAGPVQWVFRTTTESVEFAGQHFGQGERFALLLSQANRDALVFANPNLLDVSRAATAQLTLGRGMHACLGAPLIRGACEWIPAIIFQHFPHLSLDYATLKWGGSAAIKGVVGGVCLTD